VVSEQTAPVNAQERAPTMVCDIRFSRFFRLGRLIVAAGATLGACAPFGEAPGDSSPVEIGRSNDPTNAGADGGPPAEGASNDAPTPADPANPTPDGSCNGAAACKRVVFVTSTQHVAYVIGGLAGADATCTELARKSANPRVAGRTFVAWLSDSKATPLTRMTRGTDSYVRPDLKVIARDFADLTSRPDLATAIALDENGETRSGRVWTGTAPNGERSGGNCSSWTGVTGEGAQGVIGTSRRWSNASPPFDDEGEPGWCTTDWGRLYCFEQ
jgi:hypothetical protein